MEKKINNNDDGTITTTSNNMNQYINVEYWKYYACILILFGLRGSLLNELWGFVGKYFFSFMSESKYK